MKRKDVVLDNNWIVSRNRYPSSIYYYWNYLTNLLPLLQFIKIITYPLNTVFHFKIVDFSNSNIFNFRSGLLKTIVFSINYYLFHTRILFMVAFNEKKRKTVTEKNNTNYHIKYFEWKLLLFKSSCIGNSIGVFEEMV